MRKYLAEFTGTFALVFCGTGAIIINTQSNGQIGHAGVAVTFGLIVAAMIYTFGSKSGAHFNPAVTIALYCAGLFSKKHILPCIVSQTAGALTASLILNFLFPLSPDLGGTAPSGSVQQTFILELLLTFLLMLVILFTSQATKETANLSGLVIGSVVLLEAMFAGPVSGASMNPARSLAPAVVDCKYSVLWVYLTAPVTGAITAAIFWRYMK